MTESGLKHVAIPLCGEVKRVSKVFSFVGQRYRSTFNFFLFFYENAPEREAYIYRRLSDSEPFVLSRAPQDCHIKQNFDSQTRHLEACDHGYEKYHQLAKRNQVSRNRSRPGYLAPIKGPGYGRRTGPCGCYLSTMYF
jgi:hypothetical protein